MPRYMSRPSTRRRFVKGLAAGSMSLATAGTGFRVWGSGFTPYEGKLLVTLQLDGGADVTQLCDPKVNTPGEQKINNWADNAEPGEAGNIRFAPVADNFNFFNRFGQDMLVVNGVDAQTNSHETGRLYNWTGSNAEGRPSVTALHAAVNSPDQPLAYSVYGGGTSRTAGIITYNRFDDVSRLRELSQPTQAPWDPSAQLRPDQEIQEAQRLARESIATMLASPGLTPRQQKSLVNLQNARDGREGLARLAELLPSQDEFQSGEEFQVDNFNFWSNLKQQMQGALLVFKSGLGSSADLVLGGFDSHENHDPIHEALYAHFADAMDYFWAQAVELDLAHNIMVVVGSDFGRTNMYNEGNGKDHWPIGSYMIMEPGARWGNRVVGASDELHFARRIDPDTLMPSNNGIVLTPAHVHKAVQRHLGLDDLAAAAGVAFSGVEDIPLFASHLQTTA